MSFSSVILLGLALAAGVITTLSSITRARLIKVWNQNQSGLSYVYGQRTPTTDLLPVKTRGREVKRFKDMGDSLRLRYQTSVTQGAVADLIDNSGLKAQLRLIGSDTVTFVSQTLLRCVIVITVTAVFGSVSPKPIEVSTLIVLGAILVAVTVAHSVHETRLKARRYRSELLQALAGLIDFARLAAHTQSLEGALRSAVQMGPSWPFQRFQHAITQHSRLGKAPWLALSSLGQTYGIEELTELGAALTNAGSEGTRVQSMLAAKARSLRRRITETEIEKANNSTAQLGVPLGLLAVVAVAVLIAPALMAF